MLVVHSHPLEEPGTGDAGGMTVYVRQVARALAQRGVEVDIFTRLSATESPEESYLYPNVRVIQVPAGPPDLPKEELPSRLPEFTANLLASLEARGGCYDLIHSHYWLSGRVASILARRCGIPFLHTFHTLGRVKNERGSPFDEEEPEIRLAGEARVLVDATGIVASTAQERGWLIDLYSAHPERIRLIPPGVDHELFTRGDRELAKQNLGLQGKQVLLFIGRLQPLKAGDTAIRALAHLVDWGRADPDKIKLVMVGGPSGRAGLGEPQRLRELAQSLGVLDSVEFYSAQPQSELPSYYQAADVCLVPSYNESFGLVALEAQASGLPVVGSAIGGLRTIVRHGRTGFLVEPGGSEAFAERAWRILSDPPLADAMGRLAECSSREFSWERCASELYDLYVSSLA